MSSEIKPCLSVATPPIEVSESKKPTAESAVAEVALSILDHPFHSTDKNVIPEDHWGVIDLKKHVHHASLSLEIETTSRAIVVIAEGFFDKQLRCIGTAFYTQESAHLLKEMIGDWKDRIDSFIISMIVPSETVEPFPEILTKIERELKEIGLKCEQNRRWPCCPDKIIVFSAEPRCKIFMSDIF